MGYELFAKLMKHYPDQPNWINRDRFVLSAGHGSMLLYSLLHLCGYDLPMEELKNFRQWGSKTRVTRKWATRLASMRLQARLDKVSVWR